MVELTTEVTRSHRARARLAARYAARGWHILPTRQRVPILKDWENRATRDEYEARGAWDPDGPWARFNIAIACGPSGLVVIDLDTKNGKDGPAEFAALLDRLGVDVPETYTVRTPSGGSHLYFEAPPGVEIRLSASQVARGVDIRAWGGLVVAAGSEADGRPYELIDGRPPARLPAPLVDHLLSTSGRSGERKRAETVPEVIPEGQRETVLVSMAGSMRRRGMSSAAILAALEVENAERCEPPVSDEALQRIAGSVGRYEPAEGPTELLDPDSDIRIDPELLERQLVALETTRVAQEHMRSRAMRRQRAILGGMSEPMNVLDFVKSGPDPTEVCIWGVPAKGGVMGWAENQGTIIAGPPGTGKSTIGLQVLLRRCGILEGDVLGMPVKVDKSVIVYLALDRADQLRQSVSRMVPEDADPEASDRLLMIDNMPPHVDLRQVETWISWLRSLDAKTVAVDSAKDLGFDLNDSSEGQAFNFLVQATLRAGIQIFIMHHSRKTPRGDKKPLSLNDMHGSQWVAAGAGSVIMIDGEAGPDPKRLRHVKPLTVPMPPMLLEFNHNSGEVTYRDDHGEETPAPRGGRRGSELHNEILETLGVDGPMSGAALARELGSNSGAVSRALNEMSDQGLVEKVAGGWMVDR